MSFTNNDMTDNTEFGRDTGHTRGNYDSNSESTGFGRTQGQLDLAIPVSPSDHFTPPDQFDSSNTSDGYGQRATDSTTMNPSYGGMGQKSDNLSTETGGFGGSGTQADRFADRSEFNNSSMGGSSGKVPMGEKPIGGAEKLAGQVMGNTNMKERGQERKMMGSEEQNF
ncbi:hypothetical protein C8J57DRAFT_1595040 [Mycena rebaudengoi]|nr:hypothetical protein C8J57DRAFT_1595040 [Mycena rebaudengoi]